MKQTEHSRLYQLGESLIALGTAVQTLELSIPQQQDEIIRGMYSKVYQQVCSFCSKKSWCWEDESACTMEAFRDACNLLEQRGLSGEAAFSSRFQGRCHRTGQLEIALLNQMELYRLLQSQTQQREEQRETIGHQLALLGEQMQLMRESGVRNNDERQLVIGYASSRKDVVSGDSWGVQDLQDGRMVQILCDGMGSGDMAMQQSRLAVKLLQSLLAGGLSTRLSLNIVNTVMSFQYSGVRFSTIDISLWNLNTGKLELYKYGSAPSFVKNGRKVCVYTGESLPVGILPRVESALLEHEILDGDLLIMMSDGLYDLNDEGFQWEHVIRCMPTSNPQLVAEYLMAIATSRMRSNHKKESAVYPDAELYTDDMTVLVSRLV